jgi:hypothetical protein
MGVKHQKLASLLMRGMEETEALPTGTAIHLSKTGSISTEKFARYVDSHLNPVKISVPASLKPVEKRSADKLIWQKDFHIIWPMFTSEDEAVARNGFGNPPSTISNKQLSRYYTVLKLATKNSDALINLQRTHPEVHRVFLGSFLHIPTPLIVSRDNLTLERGKRRIPDLMNRVVAWLSFPNYVPAKFRRYERPSFDLRFDLWNGYYEINHVRHTQKAVWKKLSEGQKEFLTFYYGLDGQIKSQVELGEEMDLKQKQRSEFHMNALKKIGLSDLPKRSREQSLIEKT